MNGVRIVDLSRALAGPWAAQHLADQGAEVIKVEPPGGDESRGFGPFVEGQSTYLLADNRNKRSIVLDLRTDAAREVLGRLLANADVVVENYRPGVAQRTGSISSSSNHMAHARRGSAMAGSGTVSVARARHYRRIGFFP